MDEQMKAGLLQVGLQSPVDFNRIFLPDWFPTKIPWLHRGMLAQITGQAQFLADFKEERYRDGTWSWTEEDLKILIREFVVLSDPTDPTSELLPAFSWDGEKVEMLWSDRQNFMLPRGFSKTTLLNAAVVRFICYKFAKFILYVSESASHAEKQLASVRGQFESNELIISVFGDLKPARNDSNKWTDGYIEPLNGTMAGAIGRQGQVRGMSKDATRPDIIVVDDLEDSESVRNPELRQAALKWVAGTMEPAIKQFGEDKGQIYYIGTLLHNDAVLPTLMRDPSRMSFRFGALDSTGQPVWPEKLSIEGLEKVRQSFISLGMLPEFNLEYMSKVVEMGDKQFPLEKINYAIYPPDSFAAIALALDPACGEKRTADMAAFAVVGITKAATYHVLAAEGKVGQPDDEKIKRLFELYETYLTRVPLDCRLVGVEAIGYQRALIAPIEQERNKRMLMGDFSRYSFSVTPILHGKQAKRERVQGTIRPLLMAGSFSVARKFVDLENQLDSWPSGKDDIPDAVAMAIRLLTPFAGVAVQEINNATQLEPLPKNWRSAP